MNKPSVKIETPDSQKERRADRYQCFVLLCEARATLWQLGELELGEAVDFLQAYAVKHEPVRAIGQDAVQLVMARAFAAARDDLNGWAP